MYLFIFFFLILVATYECELRLKNRHQDKKKGSYFLSTECKSGLKFDIEKYTRSFEILDIT